MTPKGNSGLHPQLWWVQARLFGTWWVFYRVEPRYSPVSNERTEFQLSYYDASADRWLPGMMFLLPGPTLKFRRRLINHWR